VNPEVKDLQPKLKEVLYDCAVEIRATKAALFLYDSIGRYEIVAEYGFKGAIRQSVDRKDPIVDRCGRGRSAFFVNGLSAEPRFSEIMYESSSDRLLAAPIYNRGQLVGLIDMRDKAQKQLFDNADLPKAQKIAERIAELFAGKNVFGQRFISLAHPDDPQNLVSRASTIQSAPLPPAAADVARAPVSSSPAKTSAPLPATTAKSPTEQGSRVPRLSALIIDGRAAANRIVLPPAPESLTENELAAARDVLRAILLIPSVAVVSFAAFGHMGGIQEVAAKAVISEEASAFLQSKLNIWLAKRGESAGHTRRNVQLPFGPGTTSIQAAQMVKVFTAPVVAGSLRSLYLTVAFSANPDRIAHELLAAMLTQLQAAIERSADRASLQSLRERAAYSLLEPDFAKYPELRSHSELVAARCESLARYLEMSPSEIENVRIAALVHDVGMRLLDYDRLYRKPDISLDEIHLLREHTTVGAALVEPVLGHEIARAVLSHHERWDGTGYPNELGGEEIPRMARIIHVCDVYESMISTENYKPAQPRGVVLAMIAENGGTQFDAAIANRFIEMVR
jgi:HD-GYP domain-containing protein (c-di-GMP phosphodiesterase class II)